jgi:phosphatidylinositol alpha-mannosyltransferase
MVIPYDLAEEGGVKRHAMQLAATLRSLGDEVDVIGPCSDPGALGDHMYGFPGVINIPANGSDNRLGIFVSPRRVRRLFRDRRYDVVHVHEPLQPTLNYYAIWSAGSAARVGTFHAFMEDEGAAMLWARKAMGAVMFRGYDRGIAVSPAAAQSARQVFRGPLEIIPNGIRTGLYAGPAATEPAAGGPLRMLFVGHWRDARKGLPHLIDACAQLTARKIAWTLDVVGDGGRLSRAPLAGVTYHGPIRAEHELAARYAACDVFVSPATGAESFGIVLLEAMAAGRAIVCSDLEGYRYAVGSGAGSGARLVPPSSPGALADALGALAADPETRARLGARNRERVAQFEWDRLVGRVRDEYVVGLRARRGDLAASSAAPR